MHLGKLQKVITHTVGKCFCLRKRNTHCRISFCPQCAFIKMRNKFCSEEFCRNKSKSHNSNSNSQTQSLITHYPTKNLFIILNHSCYKPVVFFFYILVQQTA